MKKIKFKTEICKVEDHIRKTYFLHFAFDVVPECFDLSTEGVVRLESMKRYKLRVEIGEMFNDEEVVSELLESYKDVL